MLRLRRWASGERRDYVFFFLRSEEPLLVRVLGRVPSKAIRVEGSLLAWGKRRRPNRMSQVKTNGMERSAMLSENRPLSGMQGHSRLLGDIA
jgi:hypothetical protein